MAEVTDEDRAKAAEIAGWPAKNWTELRDAIAAALAEEREKALGVGRCGMESPSIAGGLPSVCELRFGHGGWHRDGAIEWGIRRPFEDQS